MNYEYQKKFKIVYRNYGIADRFDDNTIEMNKHLKNYPEIHESLLRHEARHTNNKRFNRTDLVHDLTTPNQINTFSMMKFIVRHPLSLVQFAPVYWTKKRGWIIDYNLIIGWGVLSSIVFFGLWIGNVV